MCRWDLCLMSFLANNVINKGDVILTPGLFAKHSITRLLPMPMWYPIFLKSLLADAQFL